MCGRYAIDAEPEEIARQYYVTPPPEPFRRFNVAPTQRVPLITRGEDGTRQVVEARWGLVPSWAKDTSLAARMINARAETIEEKPAFRDAFRRRRCLVPATGFYEWTKTERGKCPYFITSEGPLIAFAGLWETWSGPDGAPLRTCTIVTTTAIPELRFLHDRMPVIVGPDDYGRWLGERSGSLDDARGCLLPYPAEKLKFFEVDQLVNNVRNDGPDCIKPLVADG